jgi:glutamate synthase (NADPH/NADH) large chain
MKEDPCAVEIKYGQGAKPGDGGLLMWHKVNSSSRPSAGRAGRRLPGEPPTHQTSYHEDGQWQ